MSNKRIRSSSRKPYSFAETYNTFITPTVACKRIRSPSGEKNTTLRKGIVSITGSDRVKKIHTGLKKIIAYS